MRALLGLVTILLAGLFAATAQSAWADQGPTMSVSPKVVDVGLDFTGYDVHVSGTAPQDADVVLVVDGPVHSVKMQKKGKVMGLLWMTVDQAEVENVPSFHVVHSSERVDRLLSKDEQVRLGVDPASTQIISGARAVDANDGSPLGEEKAAEFVSALRDRYVRDDRYAPCASQPGDANAGRAADADAMAAGSGVIHLEDGRWQTCIRLPAEAPVGDCSVQVHYVRDGRVVGSDSTTFTVRKAGLVDSLGSMAKDNAPLYAAMSLGIIIVVGLATGFIFPRRRPHH